MSLSVIVRPPGVRKGAIRVEMRTEDDTSNSPRYLMYGLEKPSSFFNGSVWKQERSRTKGFSFTGLKSSKPLDLSDS